MTLVNVPGPQSPEQLCDGQRLIPRFSQYNARDRVGSGAEYTPELACRATFMLPPLDPSHAFHVAAGTVTTRLLGPGESGSHGDRPASRQAWVEA